MHSLIRLTIISSCERHVKNKYDITYEKTEKAVFSIFADWYSPFPWFALIDFRRISSETPKISKKLSIL